jgi:hypothetical protein
VAGDRHERYEDQLSYSSESESNGTWTADMLGVLQESKGMSHCYD